MALFTLSEKLLAGSILVGMMAAADVVQAMAQQKAAPPDFSSNNVGWVGLNGGGPFFEPGPGQIPPVTQDPAYPFVPNGVGRQPTYRIADLTNPNLKAWVKERMKKDNDEVLAGKIAFTPGSSCMPAGVPGFMGYGGPNPTYPNGSLDHTQSASPPRLHGRAPFGKSKAVMVWRVGWPL